MTISAARSFVLASGLILFSVAPFAAAQVTLNLTTTQQTSCVARTDANGLSLVPGSTDLRATGVTLTGTGCGSNGSSFDATLSVPGSGFIAGTAYNVLWSASAAATQCFYAGTGGLGGWPVGSSACSGAACSAPHTTAVTPSVAGSYSIGIVCTNASGVAQQAIAVGAPPLPPQPVNFALTAPATGVVGTPFDVSFSVSGASTCRGTASLPGGSASLAGWTDDATSIASPRHVTASVAGTYSLQLLCTNPAGTTASALKTIVISAGAGVCNGPVGLTRLLNSDIVYTPGGTGTRFGADLTSYDAIWGHATASDTTVTFPGNAHTIPSILAFGRTGYIAAKFHVPIGISPTLFGWVSRTDYNYNVDLTASISDTCGDFTNMPAACLASTPGGTFPRWRTGTGNYCNLVPGNDYYLNIKLTNPTQASASCPATSPSCVTGTANNLSQ